MPNGGTMTPIPQSFIGRVAAGVRYAISGITPETWFGPAQPLKPFAPDGTGGRQFDYPFGSNLQYNPRSTEDIGFSELRALADNLPLLRAVIETRKDQIEGMQWAIKPKPKGKGKKAQDDAVSKRAEAITEFFLFPDQEHTFSTWMRMLLEDMLVIDAATIYPRATNDGSDWHSFEIVDGATVKRLIDADGRTPQPPSPAYQQVLHGVPAADFTRDELLYLPRNVRSNHFYGFSPVEQIVLTVNIALKRELYTLEYYSSGTVPDAFGTLPDGWTPDQIKAFQEYFDALMTGNLSDRRRMRFMPHGFTLVGAKAPPLKDQFDEWLARIICYVFSVPVTPFVGTVNRATSETLRLQASQEGLIPLQNWIRDFMNTILWKYLDCRDLEFAWSNEDQIDPLEAAQVQDLKIRNGSLGIDEARDDDGREAIGVGNIFATASGPVPLKETVDGEIETINDPPEPLALPAPGNGESADGEAPGGEKAKSSSGEVGKSAGTPFRRVAPVPYPRPKTDTAITAMRTIWNDRFKSQREAVAAKLLGTLFKATPADDGRHTVDEFVASLDLNQPVGDLTDLYGDVASDSANLAYASVSAGDAFDQVNDRAVAWSTDRAASLVSGVDDTTRDLIRAAIADGLAQGLSADEIAAQLGDLGAFSDDRASLIADTEIAAANSNGALAGYQQAADDGVAVKKEWLLGPDPCDDCQENADAGAIDLDDAFPSGDDAPPGHPRCACDIGPVVDDTQ